MLVLREYSPSSSQWRPPFLSKTLAATNKPDRPRIFRRMRELGARILRPTMGVVNQGAASLKSLAPLAPSGCATAGSICCGEPRDSRARVCPNPFELHDEPRIQ